MSRPPAEAQPVALRRLRDYASAWRAIGCGCGECGQCDARNLTPDDADAIADEIEALRAAKARVSRSLKEQIVYGNRQAGRAERLAEALRMMEALLDEVRSSFTRDDDLPSGLLPRIDAALRDHD